MATQSLMIQVDKDWHLLKKSLLSYQHYNIPSLSAFSAAQAGLVYNHGEQTLSCPDCGLLLSDVTTHFDAFALHLACDIKRKCSFLDRYRHNSASFPGRFKASKLKNAPELRKLIAQRCLKHGKYTNTTCYTAVGGNFSLRSTSRRSQRRRKQLSVAQQVLVVTCSPSSGSTNQQ